MFKEVLINTGEKRLPTFLIDKSGHFATVKRVHVDNVQNNYKVNLCFCFIFFCFKVLMTFL